MSPPDTPRPGGGTRAEGKVELAGVDKPNGTAHRPEMCVTCSGSEPWTRARREAAADYAAHAGRRICDLPEAAA